METTMTIAIVTAQHDHAGRRKTRARASAEGKGATWRMTAHEFVSRRALAGAPPLKTRRVQQAISMSGIDRYARPDLLSLVW
jgi:hypothetical protein